MWRVLCVFLSVWLTLSSNLCYAALPAGLEGAQLAMGLWTAGLGAIGAAVIGIILANTDLLLANTNMASLEYLEDADLKSTTDGNESKAPCCSLKCHTGHLHCVT